MAVYHNYQETWGDYYGMVQHALRNQRPSEALRLLKWMRDVLMQPRERILLQTLTARL